VELNNIKFPVKLEIRIDWSELDYFGHVNNVSFFKYIQASRVNFWDIIGLTESHRNTNIGPLLASCKCDFKKPLYYPGNITVQAGVAFIGNTSFSLHHRIVDDANEIAAEAQDVMVMFVSKLKVLIY
jgi:acyl-CoA thioester hydrolase